MLLVVLAIPAIELAVIISVGGAVGVWPTVIAVFLTAIIGISLIKPQSRALMQKVQQRMNAGEPPTEETFHGVCLAAAGLFLLFPGFVTDALGFLLLLPPLRQLLYGPISRKMSKTGNAQQGPVIVDGEFHEIDEDLPPLNNPGNSDDNDDKPPGKGWG